MIVMLNFMKVNDISITIPFKRHYSSIFQGFTSKRKCGQNHKVRVRINFIYSMTHFLLLLIIKI